MSERLPSPVLPEGWPRPSGYANGMVGEGRVLSVGGQIGWHPATGKFASQELVPQAEQALRNVVAVVKSAGGTPEHIVRLTWFITDREAYLRGRKELGEAYRRVMGKHFPAMSVVVVSALIEAEARVEIEATALLPR